MGGEKLSSILSSSSTVGSPPRGRGKGGGIGGTRAFLGITPAWAGKSMKKTLAQDFPQDHPRVGGEKGGGNPFPRVGTGSPPRGRGKGCTFSDGLFSVGITPAWAGKSLLIAVIVTYTQDHPRVGGEKCWPPPPLGKVLGSPPRGRGKGRGQALVVAGAGITPAWAGKRLKRSHRSGIFISGPIPFHSVLHRPAGSGGSRAGRDGSPAGQPQNTGPA